MIDEYQLRTISAASPIFCRQGLPSFSSWTSQLARASAFISKSASAQPFVVCSETWPNPAQIVLMAGGEVGVKEFAGSDTI